MKLASRFSAYFQVIIGCVASVSIACSDTNDGTTSGGSSGSSAGARSGTGGSGNNTAGSSSQAGHAGSAGAASGGTSASTGGTGGSTSVGSGGSSTAGSSSGGTGAASSGGAGRGGSSAGNSATGGSPSAGSGGSSSGEVGCSKVTLSFDAYFGGGQNGNEANTECSGTVGEFLTTLRFDLDTDIRYDFTVQSDIQPGKTGKFNAVITARSMDLFAGPWLSKTNQCSFDVTLNQKFAETVRLAGTITCNPKELDQATSNPEGAIALKKWELVGEFALEQ